MKGERILVLEMYFMLVVDLLLHLILLKRIFSCCFVYAIFKVLWTAFRLLQMDVLYNCSANPINWQRGEYVKIIFLIEHSSSPFHAS